MANAKWNNFPRLKIQAVGYGIGIKVNVHNVPSDGTLIKKINAKGLMIIVRITMRRVNVPIAIQGTR